MMKSLSEERTTRSTAFHKAAPIPLCNVDATCASRPDACHVLFSSLQVRYSHRARSATWRTIAQQLSGGAAQAALATHRLAPGVHR